MKKIFLLLLFFSLFSFTQSQAAKVDNVLIDRIQKSYDAMQAFEADFEQTLHHRESGAEEKRKGKLTFKKPLMVRWETAKPNEETLIINKKEIWDYIPDEEIAYKYSPDLVKGSQNIIQVLTGQAKLTTDFDVKRLSPQNGLQRMQLLPDEPSTQMVDAEIWVDPATALIKQVKINDFYGNSNEVKLTSIRPQKSISDNQFKFSPPKGLEIEDRTKTGPQGKALFN